LITVVTGPPCGGKSTYVAEHARLGDVVIDADRLALALSVDGTPDHGYPPYIRHIAIGARAAAVVRACHLVPEIAVWIIHTAPQRIDLINYRQRGARIVTIDPGMEICLARAAELRPYATPIIRRWYEGSLHDRPEEPT
jgi:hypothetical protein